MIYVAQPRVRRSHPKRPRTPAPDRRDVRGADADVDPPVVLRRLQQQGDDEEGDEQRAKAALQQRTVQHVGRPPGLSNSVRPTSTTTPSPSPPGVDGHLRAPTLIGDRSDGFNVIPWEQNSRPLNRPRRGCGMP